MFAQIEYGSMRRTSFLLVALLLAAASRGARAAPPMPIVVELFTSEGCSDCPQADALLEKLIASQPSSGVEIIGLGQHVDYWDRLGWKDRFSSAALTARQQLYQTRFKTESIYTPQMVVDGRAEFVGSDSNAARRAIERASTLLHGVVRIDIDSEVGRPVQGRQDLEDRQHGDPERVALHLTESVALRVTVSELPRLGRGDRADIVVAVVEDHLRSDVKRGENHGRMLTHAAVVRYMATIGQAASDGVSSARAEIPLAADWQRDQLRVVAFVQELRGRAILASASIPLKNARQ
jgi:hypothetical protein